MTARFTVLSVTGYLTTAKKGRGNHPGLSATVVDEITGREMATFRSERVGNWYFTAESRRAEALRRAHERAAELNEWHEREMAS